MNGNNVVGISSSSALQASSYTADVTQPALVSFTLDMDAGVLAIVFDETVDAATMQTPFVILQDSAAASVNYVLTGGSSSATDSTQIDINISETDLNEIKRLALATAKATTFLRLGSAAVNDTTGNAVVSIGDGAAVEATTYTPDTTAPFLVSYDLNMRDGQVVLRFSETVDVSTQRRFFCCAIDGQLECSECCVWGLLELQHRRDSDHDCSDRLGPQRDQAAIELGRVCREHVHDDVLVCNQ